jgi:hypothetical protein
VQLGIGAEVVDDSVGGLTPERADLEEASSVRCVEHWCDCDIPQREHDVAPLPQGGEERAQ